MSGRTYPTALNPSGLDPASKVAQVVNDLRRGKGANVQDITLRASQTTTVIKDPLVSALSMIVLTPLTASARTALNSAHYTPTAGSFTITHPSNAATDQNVRYGVFS